MQYLKPQLATLVVFTLFYIEPTNAQVYQPLSTIEEAAEHQLRSTLPRQSGRIFLNAEHLDTRLHLQACSEPLQAFLPTGTNLQNTKATVGVRCNAGNTWTVYVPVNIESEIETLILNKSLAKNTSISTLDVDTRTQRVSGLMTHYTQDVKELQNKRTKRDLPSGTVLMPDMLQAQLVVKRGQQVTILAEIAGIEVRNQGIALADASPDMRIQVKNLSTAKVIEGVVDTGGVVRVPL